MPICTFNIRHVSPCAPISSLATKLGVARRQLGLFLRWNRTQCQVQTKLNMTQRVHTRIISYQIRRRDATQRDATWRDASWRDEQDRHDTTWRGVARHDLTRPDVTWYYWSWPGACHTGELGSLELVIVCCCLSCSRLLFVFVFLLRESQTRPLKLGMLQSQRFFARHRVADSKDVWSLYIYIYIERERERDREWEMYRKRERE